MSSPRHSTGPTPIPVLAWSAPATVFELTEPHTDLGWLELSLAADAQHVAALMMLGKVAQAEVFIAQTNYRTRLAQYKALRDSG